MSKPLCGRAHICAGSCFILLIAAAVPAAAQMVISTRDVTYSGLALSNPNGHCIDIRPGSTNIRIVNSTIGPCGGAGISISWSTNVTIENSVIQDTKGNAVEAYGSDQVTVQRNQIARAQSGFYVQDGQRMTVLENRFLNAMGPYPRGQFVQFNRVNGPGNSIRCNVVENVSGQSYPQEAINMFDSNGTSTSPILIEGNRIKGGTSTSGGGLMLGDGAGSWQLARDNTLVDPGQQGIAIASGNNIQVINNRVYGRQQSFTNVGIYVWNQYATPCFGHTVQGNSVDFTNASGRKNPFWNGNNCGTINGLSSNNFNATLSAAMFDVVPSSCSVTNVPTTQTGQYYLSDLPYRVIANTWGPVEKDMSNGEYAARDGRRLSIGGVSFSKGLGVHAYSDVRYTMAGKCSTFTAKVGIDDEVRPNGSVVFQVVADGRTLFDSGVVTGATAARSVSVNVTGANELALIVTSNEYSSDHADWADAILQCTP